MTDETAVDPQQIERRAYMAYHRDGLWDIFLGLIFIIYGIMIQVDQAAYMAIWFVILLPAIVKYKKSFTQKRLGYARFSEKREQKEKKNRVALTILLSFTLALGIIAFYAFTGDAGWQRWLRSLRLLPFGGVVTLIVAALGLLYGMYRLVLYAGIILAVFLAGHLFNADPAACFLLPGAVFLVVGLILMIRFMKKYPRSKETSPYDAR